jgi:hypothetical protein
MKTLLSILIFLSSLNLISQNQRKVYFFEKNKPKVLMGNKVYFTWQPVEKTYTLTYVDKENKEIATLFEYAGDLKGKNISYYKALNKFWLINRIGSHEDVEFSIIGIIFDKNGAHKKSNESIEFSN